MKKKTIMMILAAVLCIGLLVGCGSNAQPANNEQKATQAPTLAAVPAPESSAPEAVTEGAPVVAPEAPAANSGAITDQKALEIALQHAGVAQTDISRVDVHQEFEDDYGKQIFDISFHVGMMEYDYDIDAATGDILKSESEYDD